MIFFALISVSLSITHQYFPDNFFLIYWKIYDKIYSIRIVIKTYNIFMLKKTLNINATGVCYERKKTSFFDE